MKNTKKILSITLTLCLMVAVLLPMTALPAQAVGEAWGGDTDTATAFAGGTGTEADPFQISNGAELAFLASSVNSGTDYNGQYLKLTGDIALNAEGSETNQWIPIGTSDSVNFKGTFDGANFEVSGLQIDSPDLYLGLFGSVGTGGLIKNLGVSGTVTSTTDIADSEYVGGLVGQSYGDIINCNSSVTVTGNKDSTYAGGVVGSNYGTVTNCYNTGNITVTGENAYVGGVVGSNYGTVTNCYNTGNVPYNGGYTNAGGIVGISPSGSSVMNSYFLQTDSVNYILRAIYENRATVTNVGSFESASSAITIEMTADNDIPNDNLLSALKAGAIEYNNDSDPSSSGNQVPTVKAKGWEIKAVENNGYPVHKTYWSDFADGSGIDWNAASIEITAPEQLAHLANLVNGGDKFSGQTITLGGTISLTGHEWTPIGTSDSVNFNGTFDGKSFEVTNLSVESPDLYLGLFGSVGTGGLIKNLGVSGTVTNSADDSFGESKYVGGLVGRSYGDIINCNSSVTVTSSGNGTYAGSLVGQNHDTVTNSYSTGNVTATGDTSYVGGLVGHSHDTVTNSFSTGVVTGGGMSTDVGGLAGFSRYTFNSYFLKTSGVNNTLTAMGNDNATATNVGSFASATSAITWDANTSDNSIPNDNLLAALNAGARAYNKTVTDNYAAEWLEGADGYPKLGAVHWGMFADGSGVDWTATSIEITTAQQLAHFASLVNGGDDFSGHTITLGGTINISAHEWKPIGDASNQFKGTFDGKGFEVNGLQIDSTDLYLGLFGRVGESGVIKNLGVSGTVTANEGNSLVGGLVGQSNGGEIVDCYSSVTITATGNNSYVGGLVGESLSNGAIKNSYNTGNVTGESGATVGGVVGSNNGTITNSYFLKTDSVNAGLDAVGGDGGTQTNALDFDANGTLSANVTVGSYNGNGLLAALNAGDDGSDLWKWTIKTGANNGYPFLSMYWSDFADGSGIDWSATSIEITTPEQLAHFASLVSGINNFSGQTITLGGTINISAHEWAPIGISSSSGFSGTFDGKGFEVTGLYIDSADRYLGLFSHVGISGVIKNLGVSGTVTAAGYGSWVGGLAGSSNGNIINCNSDVTITATGDNSDVGGLVGSSTLNQSITNCYSTGDITCNGAGSNVGGVVGSLKGFVANCYSTGVVTGGGDAHSSVGGLAGRSAQLSTITNSYFLKTDSVNSTLLYADYDDGTATNVGTFESATSAIAWDADTSDSTIPTDSLFFALNEGARAYNKTERANYAAEWLKGATANDYPTIGEVNWIVFADGNGIDWTATTIEITTPEQLAHLAYLVNAGDDFADVTITLGNPISLTAHEWKPIGNEDNQFKGTFDGAGHEITNLHIDSTDTNVGLFGYVGNGGVIKNLGVSGTVTGNADDARVGGLVGLNYGRVINCSNTGDVTADGDSSLLGGVVGNNGGSVTNCYNTGDVTGTGAVGGVVGYNSGSVTNCYNTGDVTGTGAVGGVVGVAEGGPLTNCYNTGNVEANGASASVGGLMGYNDGRTLTNCYWLTGKGANAGVGSGDTSAVTHVGSFDDATSAITLTDSSSASVGIPTTNLLAALNAGAAAYNSTATENFADYWKAGSPYPVHDKKAIATSDITYTDTTITYGDALPTAGVTNLDSKYGTITTDNITYSYTDESDAPVSTPKNSGTYTVYITVENSQYRGDATFELTISKASINALIPTIHGTAGVDQVLTAELTGIDNSNIDWTWMVNGVTVDGHTAQTYTILPADSGKSIAVMATAQADKLNYEGTSLLSNDVVVEKMSISGVVNITDSTGATIIAGDTLTASDSAILPTEAKGGNFAWYRNSVTGTPIATTATYDVTAGDTTLIVVYTPPSNFDGKVESSVVVSKTQLTTVPTITGDTALGSELTATVAELAIDTDYTLQWMRDGVAIANETGKEYTIAKEDLGKSITVKAMGTGMYTGEAVSSDKDIAATVPDAPSVTATAGDGQITLSWTAFDGGSPITGYTVQIGAEAPIELTPNNTSYVFGNLENGMAYDFTVSATNDKGTSDGGMASATPAVPVSTGGGGGVATPDNTVDSEEPLTSDDFKELAESGDSLTVNGDDEIEAEFDTAALDAISGEAEGKTVEFIAKEADPADVNDAQKIVVGDNLVLDLRVLVDGVEFTDFATGEVTISLPYTLAEGETAANLKVYYVDAEGNKTLIESSYVDGVLTFKTNHFSLYMVTYEMTSFVDVMADDWYYDAVLYAFENEIMTGTSDTTFAPNDNMTRAMVWTVLARMSGINTDGGDPWYSVAQDWATENEVSDGTNPDGYITREEFATMLFRYAAPENVTQQTMLGQFSDGESVSEWAVAAMEWAVAEGIISGIEGALVPQGEATRAQMATMLMRYMTAE